MKHGDVWEIERRRMLVVSGDDFHQLDFAPIVIPLMRPHGPVASRYLIATTQQDNVSGLLVVPAMQPAPPGDGRRVAVISGATMARVADSLTRIFAY